MSHDYQSHCKDLVKKRQAKITKLKKSVDAFSVKINECFTEVEETQIQIKNSLNTFIADCNDLGINIFLHSRGNKQIKNGRIN